MPSSRKTPSDNASPSKPARKPAARKSPPKKTTGVEPAATRRKRATATSSGERRHITPDGSGHYDLVIVESPAKAKTINKYLGNQFRVLASYGHVRDLATGRRQAGEEVSGITIGAGWKLRYLVDAGSRSKKNKKGRRTQREILDELGSVAAKATRVLLASDPDREGESIAWHIADELGLDPNHTFRIRFNEITKNAIRQALAQPEKIDMDRVKAQEARRAMDRVVGFPLSSLLGEKVTRGLSAGRVQSVAVKLIVDREREIEAFRTEEYWKITALLAPQGAKVPYKADPKKAKIFAKKKPADSGDEVEPETPAEAAAAEEKASIPAPPPGSFLGSLDKWDGAEPQIHNEAEADAIAAVLNGVPYTVTKIEQKDRQERPQPPFTTSTLQQAANIRLRFPASRTMQTAQKLYEGVDLGSDGTVALITYMRTDSTRISPDALNTVRAHIGQTFGQPYLPEKPNFYASGKSAQEAHEAIRPTDVNITPERAARQGLAGDQLKLYTLIYNRFVACQMAPAVFAVTAVEVTAGRGLFRSTGRIMKFDGYRKVMPPAGKSEDVELPNLREQMPLDRLDLFETQHFTQPPPRFNEASLVKQLEKEGIGRPSTYASIIETIQDRGYVTQDNRRFFATDIGKVVTDLLVKHFPKIMNVKFTSHFEEELDEIETGKCQYQEVLDEFWGPFSESLKIAGQEMPALRGIETGEKCPKCDRPLLHMFSQKTGKQFIGCSGYNQEPACKYIVGGGPEPEVTDIPCPACQKPMVKRTGRFGVFYTCSGAPNCPALMNENAEGKPTVTALPTQNPCPKCEKTKLLLKFNKAGKPYIQCPDTKCKYIADSDEKGNPVQPPDTGIFCEKCNSPMVIRTSWRGPFLSCSGYPKCRNAKSINAELREKLKDILPPMPEKKAGAEKKAPGIPDVEITEKCPECDAPMRLMKSRFGGRYFLGCTKYPKCKGVGKVTPELQAKIDAASPKVQT
ncbi:MAG: type I DNA topoisomerase [Bacteroidales bacterium]|nr:type I DNA topoisomerase [Bacteroidales bacterium]